MESLNKLAALVHSIKIHALTISLIARDAPNCQAGNCKPKVCSNLSVPNREFNGRLAGSG